MKKIVEGAIVFKIQNKAQKLWYFFYFCHPGVKQGVKRSEKLQGTVNLGLGRCFSAKIKQTLKNCPETAVFGWTLDVFEDSSILTEKQWLKPKNSSSLKFLASFDMLLDPRGTKVRDEMIREANFPVCVLKYSVLDIPGTDITQNYFQYLLVKVHLPKGPVPMQLDRPSEALLESIWHKKNTAFKCNFSKPEHTIYRAGVTCRRSSVDCS